MQYSQLPFLTFDLLRGTFSLRQMSCVITSIDNAFKFRQLAAHMYTYANEGLLCSHLIFFSNLFAMLVDSFTKDK